MNSVDRVRVMLIDQWLCRSCYQWFRTVISMLEINFGATAHTLNMELRDAMMSSIIRMKPVFLRRGSRVWT